MRSFPFRLRSVALAAHHVRERAIAVPLHLEEPTRPGRNVLRKGREHRPVLPPRRGSALLVALLDQQPVPRVAVELRRHERPEPPKPGAVEPDGQAAVALLLDLLVRAVVPDLDRAGAVLAFRDLALEGRVLERMVLDVHGERTLSDVEGNTLRHGPAREHAVALQPEVVVEPPGVMALNHEDRLRLARGRAGGRPGRNGLGRPFGIAFSPIVSRGRGAASSELFLSRGCGGVDSRSSSPRPVSRGNTACKRGVSCFQMVYQG